ncbi:hypothetical protein [Achromobacter ruhlandii]|uniref:hypothetical protein n=1 Tax=Achromobacter ruhlandii TaxID=72557 RepID=UPI001581C823|nr:hypothetical protein [Achromobacter ruhlandii]
MQQSPCRAFAARLALGLGDFAAAIVSQNATPGVALKRRATYGRAASVGIGTASAIAALGARGKP